MCMTEKESILAFVIIIFISILLWIRNIKYDRVMAALFVVISLIQLTEYFYHARMIDSSTGGKSIFLILWLQVAVLALFIHIYYKTRLTKVWLILFALIFIIALFYAYGHNFDVSTDCGHLVWSQENTRGTILGASGFIYILGLFIPMLMVLYYSDWQDTGMWFILTVLLLTVLFVRYYYPKIVFTSLWCYSAVAVIFAAWLAGAFHYCGDDKTATPC